MRVRASKRTVLTTAAVAVVVAGTLTAAALAGSGHGAPQQGAGSAPSAQASGKADSSRAARPPSPVPFAETTGRLKGRPRGSLPGGWPSAATTGVPAGVRLTSRGSVRVTRSGTVLNGLDVHGEIEVAADNVTIRNSRVVNPGGTWGIIQREGHTGLTVQNCDIRGDGVRQMQFGILNQGGMITVRRADISVISNGIQTDHGLIEDSYFHDPKFFSGDHNDMIMTTSGPASGRSIVIRHNTVINTLEQTSAIALFQDFGVVHDALVTNNLLAGGGYALYAGGGSHGTPYNVQIIGNVFRRSPFSRGGHFGPVTAWDGSGQGNEWRDNVWEGTGDPVRP
jgi:hypothetical protein